jgi:hypothetical protein
MKFDPFSGALHESALPRVVKPTAPAGTDVNYEVPTLWINSTTDDAYLLVDVTGGVATWKKFSFSA